MNAPLVSSAISVAASELDLARIKKKSFGWYRKVIDSNGEDLS